VYIIFDSYLAQNVSNNSVQYIPLMSIVIAKHTNWTTNQKIIIILRII